MTSDTIDTIRNMRGCNIPWTVISRQLGYSVAECREAIGMPTYATSERQAKPWDIQPGLFDDQPTMEKESTR